MAEPTKVRKVHQHRWLVTSSGRSRICLWDVCGRRQFLVGSEWRDAMSLSKFAEKWLPAVLGPELQKLMSVDVSFPFEFHCVESWAVAFRVRFDFQEVTKRARAGAGTLVDMMNGWRSGWHEDFCLIDAEAEAYYLQRTGRTYGIGDNATAEMRRVIQSG